MAQKQPFLQNIGNLIYSTMSFIGIEISIITHKGHS